MNKRAVTGKAGKTKFLINFLNNQKIWFFFIFISSFRIYLKKEVINIKK